MIFLTVGTQLAFPRLTSALDDFAATTDETVIAQVGEEKTARANLVLRPMMSPEEFNETFQQARVVIAHAGIGTILSAKRFCRPLIIVPRRFDLGEHRNDHQLATARALVGTPGIHIAWQVEDALEMLGADELPAARTALGPRHDALISGLNRFIRGEPLPELMPSPAE